VDFNGREGYDQVRDEPLHALLCRVAHVLFRQQQGRPLGARENDKGHALFSDGRALLATRSGEDVSILLEGRPFVLESRRATRVHLTPEGRLLVAGALRRRFAFSLGRQRDGIM